MRVAVLGAGAVGGVIAALLDRAGHTVEVTARGDQLKAIRDGGIRLSGAWSEHTATVEAGEQLSHRPELAVLATKAMDAPAAAANNAGPLNKVPLVVIQNGIAPFEVLEAAAPETTVVGALSLIAASLLSPGEVSVTTAAVTWLGMPNPDTSDNAARFCAAVLSSAIPCQVIANFTGARWTKLVINQLNALPAITGCSVQEVIAEPGLRRLMASGMRETVQVALARDIQFEEMNGIGHDLLSALAESPLEAAEILPLKLRGYLGDVPNPGSTLQSIRRRQPTEIDFLNGAVVDAALGTDVTAPVNALLVKLVHEVEQTGYFFTPEQVLARASAARV